MKARSIFTRLIIGTSIVIVMTQAIGSFNTYQAMRKTLSEQMDHELEHTLSLITPELEITGDQVDNEWLEHLKNSPIRVSHELIQTWDLTSGKITRSPALGQRDLPEHAGQLGEEAYETVELNDGTKVRVVSALILPTRDLASNPTLLPENHPQGISIAMPTRKVDTALRRLLRTLMIGAAVSVLGSLLAIYLVIRSSLKPIKKIEFEIQSFDEKIPRYEMRDFKNVPSELEGLVETYRELLLRISRVREKERDFSANAAHELRTPLAGIHAILEQTLSAPREQKDYERRAREALIITKKMEEMVVRLMRFARLQSATEPISLTPVNIHALIAERICLLEKKIIDRGLTVLEILEEPDPIVRTDESLLDILICNLIENSIFHSEENSTVKVQTFFTGKHGRVEISNRPVGGKCPDLERLWEPFFRQDQTRSGDMEHSGIGMALCREIAESLGIQLDISKSNDERFLAILTFPGNEKEDSKIE